MTDQLTQHQLADVFAVDPLDLIIREAKEHLYAGNYQTCLNFLALQPKDLVESNPQVLIYQALAMLYNEYPKQAIEPILASAEQLDTAKNLDGEIAAIRAVICSYTENPDQGIKLSQRALRRVKSDNLFFRNIIQRNLGIAYTIKSDLGNANIWFEKLLLSSYQLNDYGSILACYNYLTFIRKIQGRLSDANIIYNKALEFINHHQLENTPHAIKIMSGYGHLLLYWNQVNAAKPFFHKALKLAAKSDILYGYTAFQNLCEAHIRDRDTKSALTVLRELKEKSLGKNDLYEMIHHQYTSALEARIALETGDVDHAMDWLESSNITDLHPCELFTTYGYASGYILPVVGNTYILSGMYNNALQLIKSVIPQFIHRGANSYLVRALTTLAVVYEKMSQTEKAVKVINKAITIAEAENNMGDFYYGTQSLYPTLNSIIKHLAPSYFTERLSQNLSQYTSNAEKKIPSVFENNLTNREIEVLLLIDKGMTNRQIASSLHLSTNTIKSHSLSIYRKLNVENRTQAAMIARRKGFIPSNHREVDHIFIRTY